MTARSFLDSNILIYTDDGDVPEKQAVAMGLVEWCRAQDAGVVSTQILQEYFSVTTKKLRVPVEIARRKTRVFSALSVVSIRAEDVLAAIDLHRLYQLSFWDALVVQAALQSDCSVLYSEDLQHGRRINGLEIVNPFR